MHRFALQVGRQRGAVHRKTQVDDPGCQHHHQPERALTDQLKHGQLRSPGKDDKRHPHRLEGRQPNPYGCHAADHGKRNDP